MSAHLLSSATPRDTSLPATEVLRPWMRLLLRFAGAFNLLAALCMMCFYHEGYRWLGLTGPELALPVQVMGVLVGLFGVGYLMVAARPLENVNLLRLGFWSKAISSVFALAHVAAGNLPWQFVPILFFADIAYLPPFWMILRHLRLHVVAQPPSAVPGDRTAGGRLA